MIRIINLHIGPFPWRMRRKIAKRWVSYREPIDCWIDHLIRSLDYVGTKKIGLMTL